MMVVVVVHHEWRQQNEHFEGCEAISKPTFSCIAAVRGQAPAFEAPAFEAPAFEAPAFEAPAFEAPAFEARQPFEARPAARTAKRLAETLFQASSISPPLPSALP